MTTTPALSPEMSPYERDVWLRLHDHWDSRSRRTPHMPKWAVETGQKSADITAKAAKAVGARIPKKVKDGTDKVGEVLGDKVLGPTIRSAAGLLELVNDWAAELNDPRSVVKIARKKGMEIEDFTELKERDLKECDRLLTRNTLKWRTLGAVEGGGMGALAMVPIAGLPASLTADLLVIQVMSTSIATRIAYSYGFDAKDPAEREFITRLVNRSFMAQAVKAAPMQQVANAAVAVQGRQRWSQKLLQDHRVAAALKKLLENAGASAPRASIQNVGKALPVIGVVLGAGTNGIALGAVAADAQRYCQTRFLSEKYGLPLPASFLRGEHSEEDETGSHARDASPEDILEEPLDEDHPASGEEEAPA